MADAKKPSDKRRFRRTRGQGPQSLVLTFQEADGATKTCTAKLWDFSDGGLGMDSPRAFQPGEVIQVTGALRGPVYSMELNARARVAYCRRVEKENYRVGIAFLDVAYHRLPDE